LSETLNILEKNVYLADVIESYHFVSKECEPEFTKNISYT